MTVDHDVVEPERGQRGQVCVRHQAAVVLKGQQCHLPVGNQDQATGGQKVEAQRQRLMPDDQLGDAGVVNCDDLAGDPVAEPQAALVPTRRLHQTEAHAKYVHVGTPSPFGHRPRMSPPSLTGYREMGRTGSSMHEPTEDKMARVGRNARRQPGRPDATTCRAF